MSVENDDMLDALELMREDVKSLRDEELIKESRDGNSYAFRVLVERYQRPILNYLYRYTGSVERAEELTQETFYRVYRGLSRFRVNERFRPWIYRIATNLAKNELRYRSRHPDIFTERSTDVDIGQLQSVDDRGQPYGESVRREMIERIRAILKALPAAYREALLLREQEGLTYEEIAKVTRLPLGTVRSRINRARTRFRDELQQYLDEGVAP